MNPCEGGMKRSAVRVITILAVLLAAVTTTMVWLVGNEFEAENQLNEIRVKLGELQRQSTRLRA